MADEPVTILQFSRFTELAHLREGALKDLGYKVETHESMAAYRAKHAVNGHAVNGQAVNGQAVNGQAVNGHAINGHSGNPSKVVLTSTNLSDSPRDIHVKGLCQMFPEIPILVITSDETYLMIDERVRIIDLHAALPFSHEAEPIGHEPAVAQEAVVFHQFIQNCLGPDVERSPETQDAEPVRGSVQSKGAHAPSGQIIPKI